MTCISTMISAGPETKAEAMKRGPSSAVFQNGRADAIAYLSQRVRKGGPGNWGVIPMVPNDVSKLSEADLKTLLTWILGMAK